jgi:hypothetical protein
MAACGEVKANGAKPPKAIHKNHQRNGNSPTARDSKKLGVGMTLDLLQSMSV